MSQRRLKKMASDLDAMASALRREAVRRLRSEGKTFAEIAKDLGFSRARAHELWKQAEEEAS